MGTVSHYIEVDAPAEQAYTWWRGLTNLPTIMPDVESVEPRAGTEVTHWRVQGPMGRLVEWDARIVEDVPNSKIAWASIGGADDDVRTSGVVRFDAKGDRTGIEVSLTYDPPAGAAGEAVAKLFSDPQRKVEHALAAFKTTIEGGGTSGTGADGSLGVPDGGTPSPIV